MIAAHTIPEMLGLLVFIIAGATLIFQVLTRLDTWLEADIAAERAEIATDGTGKHRVQ